MNVVVFTGPTLPERDARQYLEADYRPPAAIGDVYKAALSRPFAIGIIDGYYETTPSIWHKEVLWALKQGIHVYGAASMGALRAAELAAFRHDRRRQGVRGLSATASSRTTTRWRCCIARPRWAICRSARRW